MKPAPKKAIVPVVALSLMTVMSAVSGLMVSLPSIAIDTGATQTQLTWIVDSYTVVFAGLLLLAGAIADQVGRKRVLLLGLGIYIAANVIGLNLSDPQQLMAVRAFTGIGAAFIMPSTLSIITTSFEGAERGKAIGVWVGVAGGGAFVGLFGTSWLLNYYAWHSFFGLNLVLATIAFLGTVRVIPESRESVSAPLDIVGGLISVIAVGSLVFGIIEGPERGWSDALTIAGLVIGLLAFVAFTLWELRIEHPLLDPRLFRNTGFTAGSIGITVQFLCLFGFIFVGLQYLQYVAGFSPWEATKRLLLIPVVMLPMSRISGHLATRIPQKKLGAVGFVIFGAGMFVFTTMNLDFQLPRFWTGLALMVAGMALSAVPATTAITSSLPGDKQGVASAVNDVSRELGSAVGIAVLGSALNTTYRSHLTPALTNLPAELATRFHGSVAFVKVDPHTIVAAHPEAQPILAMWDSLVLAGQTAFADGMHVALKISGTIALLAAVFVGVVAPNRMPEHIAGE